MEQEWRDIEEFEGLYKINNNGDILSLPRNGTNGGILKSRKNKYGYQQVVLFKNNHPYTKLVHRLVAKAFIKNPKNKPQINHLNNIRDDNRVENLEWCTNIENLEYSHNQNRQYWNRKEILAFDKQNNKQIKFKSQREAERILNIKQYNINKILKNKKIDERWDFKYAK